MIKRIKDVLVELGKGFSFVGNQYKISTDNNDYYIDKVNLSEKLLKQLILEDMDNFLKELGNGFSYIGNEYKIKIGDRYNYIDKVNF